MYLTFNNPLYLWFLFLIPIFIVLHYYFLKRSTTRALIFSNMKALRRMSKKNLLTSNTSHLILRCLVIFALIVAASGATLWVMGDKSDVNIIFAVDSSASMTSQDIGTSRFDTAKSMVRSVLDVVPRGADVALLNFAGTTMISKSFTEEKSEILLSLEQLDISRMGGTDLGGLIITASNLFELKPDEGKMLIILSDGLDNKGSFISGSPLESLNYAKEHQVIINSIAIGTQGGPIGYLPEYYDIPSMFDDELMINISEQTGGNHYRVESVNDVQNVIDELSFDDSKGYVAYNLYYWAFLVVFFLLIVEWIFANTIYRRVL